MAILVNLQHTFMELQIHMVWDNEKKYTTTIKVNEKKYTTTIEVTRKNL